MEEKPIFKLKKSNVIVGGIDVNGPSEWELLIKHDTHDLPKFIHFQKMWNILETEDEVDENGQILKPGIKQQPVVRYFMGFIKDEKFVVTTQNAVSAMNFHDAYKKLKAMLEGKVADGFKKDEQGYAGAYAACPQYYSNERTPMTGMNSMSNMNLGQLVQSAMPAPTGNVNVSVTPKKKKSISDIFNSIKVNNP